MKLFKTSLRWASILSVSMTSLCNAQPIACTTGPNNTNPGGAPCPYGYWQCTCPGIPAACQCEPNGEKDDDTNCKNYCSSQQAIKNKK